MAADAETHDSWVTDIHLLGVLNATQRLKVTEEQRGLPFFSSRKTTSQVLL